jgi:hypothetical protein
MAKPPLERNGKGLSDTLNVLYGEMKGLFEQVAAGPSEPEKVDQKILAVRDKFQTEAEYVKTCRPWYPDQGIIFDIIADKYQYAIDMLNLLVLINNK